MTEDLEYIQRYFEGKFNPQELTVFEKRIQEDPSFAGQIAFYITALRAAKQNENEQKKERFREIYSSAAIPRQRSVIMKMWPYVAAALIAGITLLIVFYPHSSPDQIADKYIAGHLQTLSVTMGNEQSEFQTGVRLYNEGKMQEALIRFENVVKKNNTDIKAKENAGIVSLRLEQYDKALQYFSELENYPGLYANPGKFYHALTLMKRNRPGDTEQARKLLQQVINQQLDLDREAQELLKKL